MRPIKFRAWNNQLKTMADNENFQGALGGLILAVKSDGEEFTFMQWTGLKDRDGRDIYEGDIIFFNDFAHERTGGNVGDTIRKCVVKFLYDGYFAEDIADEEYQELLYTIKVSDEELEVIGNIYEGAHYD